MRRLTLLMLLTALLAACATSEPVIVATAPAQAVPGPTQLPRSVSTPQPSSTAIPAQDIAVPDEGREHVEEGTQVTYKHIPPASGPHYPVTLQYGLYEQDVPEGYWIHNLEHGAIVILYKCSQPCPDLVKSLGDMLDSFPLTKWNNRKIVIAAYGKMDVPLMAVAWDVQMPLDQFNPQALIDFYTRHVDQGPENVP
jgi:hypothetical protein